MRGNRGNQLTDFQEKQLELLEEIKEKLTIVADKIQVPTAQGGSILAPVIEDVPIELNPEDWLSVAQKYVGLDEHDDTDAVKEMLQQGKVMGLDPTATPWCAAFVRAILNIAGLQSLNTLRARDWAEYGEECEEKVGAIVVYRSHVGFVPEIGKVLGGNQSDGINIGSQSWYGKPIAYRWPVA